MILRSAVRWREQLAIWASCFSDRLLAAAGIPKRDDRGRTLDIHALRHTFGTLMSKGGVAPRTAQAAMRHSDIKLTMNVYTDPRLLDVRGALDALPALPLTGNSEGESLRRTGTDAGAPEKLVQHVAPLVAPTVALTADNQGHAQSTFVRLNTSDLSDTIAVSACSGNEKGRLTSPVNRPSNRGESRCTFVNEIIGLPLALSVFPQVFDFPGEAVLELVEPGLYRKGRRSRQDTA
jgi:hypothetical protein